MNVDTTEFRAIEARVSHLGARADDIERAWRLMHEPPHAYDRAAAQSQRLARVRQRRPRLALVRRVGVG